MQSLAEIDEIEWRSFQRSKGYNPAFVRRVREQNKPSKPTAEERRLARLIAQQQEELAALQAERAERDARAWRSLSLRSVPIWVRELIQSEAEIANVEVSDIIRDCRIEKVRLARNKILYQIKEQRPKLYATQIAAWFGKDHTAVLYSIALHARTHDLPPLTGYNVERSQTMKRNRYHQKRNVQ